MTQQFAAAIALVLALAVATAAHAHPVVPPRPIEQPSAEWPPDHVLEHDLVIPVVLLIDEEGRVEEASVEAGVGEPFDSIAVRDRAALAFRGSPRRCRPGQRQDPRRRALRRRAEDPVARGETTRSLPTRIRRRTATRRRVPTRTAPSLTRTPGSRRPKRQPDVEILVRGEARARSASELRRDRAVLSAAPHRTASDLLLDRARRVRHPAQRRGQGASDLLSRLRRRARAGHRVLGRPARRSTRSATSTARATPTCTSSCRRWCASCARSPGTYDPRQGDFAVAGSMDFDLGYAEPGITLKAGAGSFGRRRGFVAYHPADAPERTFAAAEIEQSDGYGVGRAADRASAIAQVEHRLGDGLALRLMASAYAAALRLGRRAAARRRERAAHRSLRELRHRPGRPLAAHPGGRHAARRRTPTCASSSRRSSCGAR